MDHQNHDGGTESEDLQTMQRNLLKTVAAGTRAANGLPLGRDFEFHNTSAAFGAKMHTFTKRVHTMMESLVKRVDPSVSWGDLGDAGPDVMDDDDRMESLTDITDALLERVDGMLDVAKNSSAKGSAASTGRNDPAPAQAFVFSPTNKTGTTTGRMVQLLHASNIRRPQLSFSDKVDNSRSAIFVPKIRDKPNAKEPLDLEPIRMTASGEIVADATQLGNTMVSHMSTLGIPRHADKGELVTYPHPYQPELDAYEPKEDLLTKVSVTDSMPWTENDCTWVDTKEALLALKETLDGVSEFAVDLEAHQYRTFASFACLMQLSTRTRDYLVDVLALRAEMHVLNSSFTNADIVKVLHGSDSDILWLQKDLGLYLVNMFDTGQAARVLTLPKFSLAYLLQTYCNVTPNKAYQLADWRIRPLTKEMAYYAQEDTHYLLYLYDVLRNQLIAHGNQQANLLRAVWMRSRDICLQKYEIAVFDPEGYQRLLDKHSRSLTGQHLHVFKALFDWRDQTARDEDESIRYVLPDHMLFDLADVCPREATQVVACCTPTPPLVRMNAHVILEVITTAVDAYKAVRKKQAASSNVIHASRVPPRGGTVDHGATTVPATSGPALAPLRKLRSSKQLVCDVDAVSAMARLLVTSAANENGAMEVDDHEAFAKASDVRKAFCSERLFGVPFVPPTAPTPAESSSAHPTSSAPGGTAASSAAPAERAAADKIISLSKTPRLGHGKNSQQGSEQRSNQKRKGAFGGQNDDIHGGMQLSKMPRTHFRKKKRS
eukprot:m.11373 g.11373  ORF g.11373 m.11373 type:complete len:773 (+) comp8531_c0_seq2:158-2476(+)